MHGVILPIIKITYGSEFNLDILSNLFWKYDLIKKEVDKIAFYATAYRWWTEIQEKKHAQKKTK